MQAHTFIPRYLQILHTNRIQRDTHKHAHTETTKKKKKFVLNKNQVEERSLWNEPFPFFQLIFLMRF